MTLPPETVPTTIRTVQTTRGRRRVEDATLTMPCSIESQVLATDNDGNLVTQGTEPRHFILASIAPGLDANHLLPSADCACNSDGRPCHPSEARRRILLVFSVLAFLSYIPSTHQGTGLFFSHLSYSFLLYISITNTKPYKRTRQTGRCEGAAHRGKLRPITAKSAKLSPPDTETRSPRP